MAKNTKKKHSQFSDFWRRLKKNIPAMIGLVIILLLCFVALFGNVIIDDELATAQNISERLMKPCAEHPFGTDAYGRDMFARVIHGTKSSLGLGFGTTAIALIAGVLIGACSAFYGGVLDNVLMRFIDILSSTPPMLLAMILVATLGASMINLMLAIGIAGIPTFARLSRATMLNIIDQDYIVAAKTYGTKNFRVMLKHIVPNAMGPLIVQATMTLSSHILTAASLSYIGLGLKPPAPEWGALLNAGRENLQSHMYLTLFPGLALVLAALSISLFGDGLRDALDPRLKS